ncbi:sigma 54 modulation/S30EA ribosomal C-terminal domain-containing protein [Kitasatospora sp. NPDC048545]|uniref:sigma 54 modulation/S30EA ribosomal C-terminal domain-containing protein n=1 Tax=Kitasatospora sp. NPDC048545 TaxID=3157208 RepID=UPI0033FB0D1C
MNRPHTPIAHDIRVRTRGEVSLAAPDYARAKLLAVVERLHEPVLATRVKLTREPAPGLTVSTTGVPDLAMAEAVSRLDLTGLPFVFFTDTATGRGNVIYHRYDGHYGLITPAQ